MYETALNKEKSEDYMTCLFMAHVRTMDFQSQHKIALQLYKNYSKRTYLVWAVVSLYVKSQLCDQPEIAKSVTLPLAVRMMEKFISEAPACAEHEYFLYILLLCKIGEYQKALTALEESKFREVVWTKHQYERVELACLKQLGNEERLVEVLERNILLDSSVLTCYRDYVLTFGDTKTERLMNFLRPLAYDGELSEMSNRSALVSLIWLYEFLDAKGMSCELDVNQLFVDYMKRFATKPFFLRDMRRIVAHLKNRGSTEVLAQLSEEVVGSKSEFQNMQRAIQWRTNFDTLKFYLHEEKLMASPLAILDYSKQVWHRYIESVCVYEEKQLRTDERDSAAFEDYLITITVVLTKTFWSEKGNVWNDFFVESKLGGLHLKDPEESAKDGPQENGIGSRDSKSLSNIFLDHEFPILLNLVLLEKGLIYSPFCNPYRYLLGKLYFFCGAPWDGLEQLMKMDIKHMQFDSIGYLILPKILGSGNLSDAGRTICFIASFYNNSAREFLEHVISAYKYCSWSQITDFLDFRFVIQSSIQATSVFVEKALSEYSYEAFNRDTVIRIALRDENEVRNIFTRKYVDNRDFKISNFLFECELSTEVKTRTFADAVEYTKTRSAILSTISCFAVGLTLTCGEEIHYVPCIQKAVEGLELLAIQMNTPFEILQNKPSENYLHGPWAPKLFDYLDKGFVSCLYEFLMVIKCAERVNSGPESSSVSNMDAMEAAMEVATKSLEKIAALVNKWKTSEHHLYQMCDLNEEMSIVVETLGFLCIILDLVKGYLERSKSNSGDNKGKRKRGKEQTPTTAAAWCAPFNALVTSVVSLITVTEGELTEFETASKSWYVYNWTDEEDTLLKEKIPEVFVDLMKSDLPVITEKLRTNLAKVYFELKRNVSGKRQYAESLLITNVSQ